MQFDPELGKVDWDGLITFLITLLLVIVTAGVPLIISLAYVIHVARSAPNYTSANWLLVFGKRLVQGQIDMDYQARLNKAATLMKDSSNRHLMLVGGSARAEEISEAGAGQAYLESTGVNASRLMREEKSQNTLENLRHARQLMSGLTTGVVAMISNSYHLARIHTIANSLGIAHELCSSETRFSFSLKSLPRLLGEAWYILWFQTGKSWARLIGSQRMLDRVT